LDAWLDAHTHAGTSLFNVQGYGAVGGNVTKDTLAINEAIADLNAEGSGLLWFPPLKAGVTYTSSGIDPITVPCTVAGAGRSSAVTTTVDGDIFTVSAVSGKVDFVNLSIAGGRSSHGGRSHPLHRRLRLLRPQLRSRRHLSRAPA